MSITFFVQDIPIKINKYIKLKTSIRNHQIKHTWSIKVVLSLGFTLCSPHQVAGGFARWQTNQHEFPALAARPRRAMYWLAPKVAHSCDPNVGWEDPAEATWAILVGGDWETC